MIGVWGDYLILVSITLFAYSSILEGYVYCEVNLSYLEEDGKYKRCLQLISLFMVFIGSVIELNLVWSLMDFAMIF